MSDTSSVSKSPRFASATISNEAGYSKTWFLFLGHKIRCPKRIAWWLVEKLP